MRGQGTTTCQMKSATFNAVYVWLNDRLAYPNDIARELGRTDIQIVSPSWLSYKNICGRTFSGIILDHATRLNYMEDEVYQIAKTGNVPIKNDVLQKCIRVILSCKTPDHVIMAEKYCNLAYRKLRITWQEYASLAPMFQQAWKGRRDWS